VTRKAEVIRPFPPEFVSAETLAYLLDMSRTKLDDDVRSGLLPKPVEVGTLRRWRWRDVDAHILARNGRAPALANASVAESPSEADPFLTGLKNVSPSHA
jgi:predicted DNA-binding transcriptional regulator AlpA